MWSHRNIVGAIAHDAGQFDKHLCHLKFDFLQKQAARLNYDYFVWLDADNYFVRQDYMSAEQSFRQFAIVDAMRSKQALAAGSS